MIPYSSNKAEQSHVGQVDSSGPMDVDKVSGSERDDEDCWSDMSLVVSLSHVVDVTAPPMIVGSSANEKLHVHVLLCVLHGNGAGGCQLERGFDDETLAQLLEVVGATVASAIAAHEESGGSQHDSSGGFQAGGRLRWPDRRWIATLEATSLNDGDLEQMATELFDMLAMTVKDDALTTIQGITNFNGIEAWVGMLPLLQRRLWWRLCES